MKRASAGIVVMLTCLSAAPVARADEPARDAVAGVDAKFVELRGREGFWQTGRDDAGVWWFVRPDGRREFLNSVTTVQPKLLGRAKRGPHYFARGFDPRSTSPETLRHWAADAIKRVESFGFK